MHGFVGAMRRSLFRRKIVSGLLTILSVFSRLMLVGIGAWLIAQAIDRDSPVDAKVFLAKPSVVAGSDLKVDVQLYRKRICRAKATWMVFDGRDVLSSIIEGQWLDAPGGVGNDSFSRKIGVPENAAPGTGRLRLERSYKCTNNVFHDRYPISVVEPDMPFTIESKP